MLDFKTMQRNEISFQSRARQEIFRVTITNIFSIQWRSRRQSLMDGLFWITTSCARLVFMYPQSESPHHSRAKIATNRFFLIVAFHHVYHSRHILNACDYVGNSQPHILIFLRCNFQNSLPNTTRLCHLI